MQFLKGSGVGLAGGFLGFFVVLLLIMVSSVFTDLLTVQAWVAVVTMVVTAIMTWDKGCSRYINSPWELFFVSIFSLGIWLIVWCPLANVVMDFLELSVPVSGMAQSVGQITLAWLINGVVAGIIAHCNYIFDTRK